MMATVKFSRTTAWDSGWRGKHNVTDITIDGQKCGAIEGSANTATAGAMNYSVECKGEKFSALSLADAKKRVRAKFS